MRLETPLALALNRLLETESWAYARLAPFAGQAVELRAPPLPPLRFALGADGRIGPAPQEQEPSLAVTWRAGAPPEVAGDAALAAELASLARHLRWDAEEELSRVVGDVAAHRIAEAGRALAAWPKEAAERLLRSATEHTAAGRGPLVARAELEREAVELARLREALARLTERLDRLGR